MSQFDASCAQDQGRGEPGGMTRGLGLGSGASGKTKPGQAFASTSRHRGAADGNAGTKPRHPPFPVRHTATTQSSREQNKTDAVVETAAHSVERDLRPANPPVRLSESTQDAVMHRPLANSCTLPPTSISSVMQPRTRIPYWLALRCMAYLTIRALSAPHSQLTSDSEYWS